MSQVWTSDDPGVGDVAALRWRAAELERVATMLADVHGLMRTHQGSVDASVWSGAAAEAFRAGIEDLCARVRLAVDPIAAIAAELRVYAGTVERIADDTLLQRVRRDDALDDRRAAVAVRDRIPHPGETLDASTIAWASAQVQEADDTLAAVGRALDALAEERRAADARVRGALQWNAVPAWDTLGAAMQEAGIRSPEHLTWRGIRVTLVDLARRVVDGEPEVLDELGTVLEQWGSSPSLMSAFLRDLGGRDLADLMSALDGVALGDPATVSQVGDLQDALRRALALGAEEWDAAQHEEFAAALLTGTNAALVAAYLFSDVEGAPMPAGLVCATLDALAAREKDGLFVWQVDPDAGGIGPLADGLLVPLGEGSPYSVADPAGSLFRQAAGHPRDVLDWLAGEGGAERIAYWYGERDWLAGGGWTGPMLVWEAVQTVPGALVGSGADPALVDQLVDVNVGIINAWMADPDRLRTPMDSEALVALAGVVESQLPIWLETVLANGDDLLKLARETDLKVLWMGTDGVGASVQVSKDTLATLLALVAGDRGAATRLTAGSLELQADLIASIGNAPGVDHTGIIDRIAEALGAIDGAHLAAELSAADLQDELVRRQVAVGGLLLGELFSAAGVTGAVAAGILEDGAAAAWADSYATALHAFLDGTGPSADRAEDARAVLESLVVGWVPEEVIAVEGGIDQYLGRRMDEYDDERSRLDSAKAGQS